MEKQRSPKEMSKERRQLLHRSLSKWLTNLRLDEVLFYLQKADVVENSASEHIKSLKTAQERIFAFIHLLEKRGNEAFVHFYHALLFSNQGSIASCLDAALTTEEKRCGRINVCFPNDVEALREVGGNTLNKNQRSKTMDEEERKHSGNRGVGSVERDFLNLASTSAEHGGYVIEPRGILDDLFVESIDSSFNNGLDLSNFDEQKVYRNFSNPRGLALIINNRVFRTMTERVGTEIDECNLRNLLIQLGYTVFVSKDLTAKEMLQTFKAFAKRQEHKKVDSCIVSVLTHGENNELFGVDEEPILVNDFVSQLNALNCPALAQKPKIFILQACRGQRYDPGVGVSADQTDALVSNCFGYGSSRFSSVNSNSVKKLPTEADFLVAYATVPGYVSWRNNIRGSWFIQSICEIFAKFAKQLDILDMLTLVNKRVAEVYESSSHSYKQVPECATRLRRKFFFFPGLSAPLRNADFQKMSMIK